MVHFTTPFASNAPLSVIRMQTKSSPNSLTNVKNGIVYKWLEQEVWANSIACLAIFVMTSRNGDGDRKQRKNYAKKQPIPFLFDSHLHTHQRMCIEKTTATVLSTALICLDRIGSIREKSPQFTFHSIRLTERVFQSFGIFCFVLIVCNKQNASMKR